MILYHTSDRIIKEPDIHRGRSNTDFGQGFYLTPDKSFAGNWARERTSADIYVNRYELSLDGLRVKEFGRDAGWFEYIFRNRRSMPDSLEGCDVIMGPIANDTLFETFGIITSGLLTTEQALELLSIGPAYTQVALRTDKAAAALTWLGADVLSEESMVAAKENYKKVSTSYEEEFAKALNAMDVE